MLDKFKCAYWHLFLIVSRIKKNEKEDKQAKIVYEIMTNAAIKNR